VTDSAPSLAAAVLSGSRRALARALTWVENEHPDSAALLSTLYPHGGRAWVVGITGAPGTGKSSLVTALALRLRQQGETVAILAVDPTSPFTGGAILGDRIRMRDLSGDSGVFIRSMATRGSLGGLARTTRDAIRVLDAAGFDRVLVETVGAGQSEVDIARAAQTTVVVEAPGLGDDVQAIKAGILEIADVLAVNKADRAGAENTVRALRAMLELGHPTQRNRMVNHHGQRMSAEAPTQDDHEAELWVPPLVRTVATREATPENDGIGDLLDAIDRHRAHLTHADGDKLRQRQRGRIEGELLDRLSHALMARLLAALPAGTLEAAIDDVQSRQRSPHHAVQSLLDSAGKAAQPNGV
jgi:LAO/AO transport system kinase